MAAKSIVSIVSCSDYEPHLVSVAVNEAIDLAELGPAFAPGKSVLIKPNLLSARQPEDAVTTHPSVVRALAETALNHGCRPTIGDSPPFAGENPARWLRLMQATGMSQVTADLGIELQRFEDARVQVANPDGRIYRSFEIGEAVARADVVVNVPKLKTHGLTMLTGAVKNVFGCVPGIQKGLFHVKAAEDREVFAQMLVDVCGGIKPAVHVMDAIVALEGEGPNHGTPKAVGAVLASSDPVALDAVASAMIGVDPFEVHTTRLAHEQGLGCGDLTEIEIRGTPLEQVIVRNFRLSSGANEWARIPRPIRKFLRRQLVASPRVDARECVGCGDCARACPVEAIADGRPPVVDYEKCIRCYCCNEVCNYGAIKLKPGLLGRLVSRLPQKK
jgi:uncharacterized protein (DUF362 family)/NAD-dependent dihydropyrimidine dehydrogenase PreA subunit